ncbi:MAG TPA: Minf_1886 family protein [Chthoniobacteraceae bacterium]|jgi:uncharacterized repeat protein (TIGR04138 family)|nr:Minf_1886 family protein [Chthoniobacteraceae bacterium]
MPKLDFAEALDLIISHDPRYARDGYHFLREALDYTIRVRARKTESATHVTGPQLLDGIRQYALKEFGPMVPTVFESWGIARCEDFGEMVFNLIRVGIFGKTDRDSIDDFKGGYSFFDAFVAPYVPEKPAVFRRVTSDQPAEELS